MNHHETIGPEDNKRQNRKKSVRKAQTAQQSEKSLATDSNLLTVDDSKSRRSKKSKASRKETSKSKDKKSKASRKDTSFESCALTDNDNPDAINEVLSHDEDDFKKKDTK